MAALVQVVIISFLVLVFLLQRIDVTISASRAVPLKISSVIWSLSFCASKKMHKSKLKLSKRLSLFMYGVRVLKDLIPKSDITVSAPTSVGMQTARPFYSFIASAFALATEAYVSRRANSCTAQSYDNESPTEVNISFPLFSLCISTLKVAYYTIKSKRRRRRGHG